MSFTTETPTGSNLDFVEITQDVIKHLTGFEIHDQDELNIPHIEYFKKLGSVLAQIPEEDLEHYLTFRELINLAKSTTSKMRDYFQQWGHIKGGPEIAPPRKVFNMT